MTTAALVLLVFWLIITFGAMFSWVDNLRDAFRQLRVQHESGEDGPLEELCWWSINSSLIGVGKALLLGMLILWTLVVPDLATRQVLGRTTVIAIAALIALHGNHERSSRNRIRDMIREMDAYKKGSE